MDWALATIALAVLAVATVSSRLSGRAVTTTMAFVAIGILLGPRALDAVDVPPASSVIRVLAEATLAFVLFADASRIDLSALRRGAGLPVRLLGIGLPLTIAAGTLAAVLLFPDVSALEALVLAILLAPTDAALGQAVVTEPRLPLRDPAGTQRRERAERRHLRPAAAHRARGRGGRAGRRERRQRDEHRARVDRLRGARRRRRRRDRRGHRRVAGRPRAVAAAWLPWSPGRRGRARVRHRDPLGGSGFIAAFVAGLVFTRLVGPIPGRWRISASSSASCSTP